MLQPCKSPIYPLRVPKLLLHVVALLILPVLTLAPAQSSFAAAARKHRTTKVASARATRSKHTSVKVKKPLGPRSIDDQRATQIQAALIKAGYLTGEPSGHWDSASQAAMVKLQGDNGWQTKLVPDSRALIKLGLGPGAGQSDTTASSASPPAPATP
jgi:hypothetical protein